jgi:hypothetical protein
MSGIEIRKAVIKNADMSEEMQADAVDCATQVPARAAACPAGRARPPARAAAAHAPRRPQALEKFNIEKDIAAYIKKEFDKKYNPTWHCIVGRNFGERRAGPDPRAAAPPGVIGPALTRRRGPRAQAPTSRTRPSTSSTSTSVSARAGAPASRPRPPPCRQACPPIAPAG